MTGDEVAAALKTVFVVTFGQQTLRNPRMVGVFSTREKARAATERDFEETKRRQFPYISSTDYQIDEYFVDK